MTPQQQRQIDRMIALEKIAEICESYLHPVEAYHSQYEDDRDLFNNGYVQGKAEVAYQILTIINGKKV